MPRESGSYSVECENGHEESFDATSFESFLSEGDFECRKCGKPLSFQGEDLILECTVCGENYYADGLEDARSALDGGSCGHCENNGFDNNFHVSGSKYDAIEEYEWTRNGVSGRELLRGDRIDYWEGVIHFCKREEFIKIFEDGRIRAFPTGKYKLPAVCLTETPSSHCAELMKKHGDYGYVFKKNALMKIGGNPALYMTPDLISDLDRIAKAAVKADVRNSAYVIGSVDHLRRYVTMLTSKGSHPFIRKYDYLHEREWRVPHDIEFDKLKPFGIILPRPRTMAFFGDDGNIVMRAAKQFQELEDSTIPYPTEKQRKGRDRSSLI